MNTWIITSHGLLLTSSDENLKIECNSLKNWMQAYVLWSWRSWWENRSPLLGEVEFFPIACSRRLECRLFKQKLVSGSTMLLLTIRYNFFLRTGAPTRKIQRVGEVVKEILQCIFFYPTRLVKTFFWFCCLIAPTLHVIKLSTTVSFYTSYQFSFWVTCLPLKVSQSISIL